MKRILYHCSDLERATGGIRRLYRHVEILTVNGFNAFILHNSPGFRIKWFENTAPIEYWNDTFRPSIDDVIVIPEGHTNIMRRTVNSPCKRVVIALNWKRIFSLLAEEEDWRTLGIRDVIAGSSYEQHFILNTMNIQSTVIASGIDTDFFTPLAKERTCWIAYMPQKNRDYAHLIEAAFCSMYSRFLAVRFVPIEGRSHREVAEILGRSAIFLAHTFPEGLSRKMLEAMACGCVVVGFAGRGSQECMKDGTNCHQLPDGDILGVVERLGSAVTAFYDRADLVMREAAIATAHTYSLRREEDAVIRFWTSYCA